MNKTAVTLAALRIAYKALAPKIIRRNLSISAKQSTIRSGRGIFRKHLLRKAPDIRQAVTLGKRAAGLGSSELGVAVPRIARGTPAGKQLLRSATPTELAAAKQLEGKAYLRGDFFKNMRRYLRGPAGGKMSRRNADIVATGGIPTPKTPAGREFFNRTVGLHEGSELAAPLGSRYATGKSVAGHRSVHPPLRDLNIAATATGPGAEAAKSLHQMRMPEISALQYEFPTSFGRLPLGEKRLSRHAINRLEQVRQQRIGIPQPPPAVAQLPKRVPAVAPDQVTDYAGRPGALLSNMWRRT